MQNAKEKKTDKTDDGAETQNIEDGREYVTIEAESMDELLSKVQKYSYSGALNRVLTESERMIGSHVDFMG